MRRLTCLVLGFFSNFWCLSPAAIGHPCIGPGAPFTLSSETETVTVTAQLDPPYIKLWLCDVWGYPGYQFGVEVARFHPLEESFTITAEQILAQGNNQVVGTVAGGFCSDLRCFLSSRITGDPVLPYHELWIQVGGQNLLLGEFELLGWPILHRMFL